MSPEYDLTPSGRRAYGIAIRVNIDGHPDGPAMSMQLGTCYWDDMVTICDLEKSDTILKREKKHHGVPWGSKITATQLTLMNIIQGQKINSETGLFEHWDLDGIFKTLAQKKSFFSKEKDNSLEAIAYLTPWAFLLRNYEQKIADGVVVTHLKSCLSEVQQQTIDCAYFYLSVLASGLSLFTLHHPIESLMQLEITESTSKIHKHAKRCALAFSDASVESAIIKTGKDPKEDIITIGKDPEEDIVTIIVLTLFLVHDLSSRPEQGSWFFEIYRGYKTRNRLNKINVTIEIFSNGVTQKHEISTFLGVGTEFKIVIFKEIQKLIMKLPGNKHAYGAIVGSIIGTFLGGPRFLETDEKDCASYFPDSKDDPTQTKLAQFVDAWGIEASPRPLRAILLVDSLLETTTRVTKIIQKDNTIMTQPNRKPIFSGRIPEPRHAYNILSQNNAAIVCAFACVINAAPGYPLALSGLRDKYKFPSKFHKQTMGPDDIIIYGQEADMISVALRYGYSNVGAKFSRQMESVSQRLFEASSTSFEEKIEHSMYYEGSKRFRGTMHRCYNRVKSLKIDDPSCTNQAYNLTMKAAIVLREIADPVEGRWVLKKERKAYAMHELKKFVTIEVKHNSQSLLGIFTPRALFFETFGKTQKHDKLWIANDHDATNDEYPFGEDLPPKMLDCDIDVKTYGSWDCEQFFENVGFFTYGGVMFSLQKPLIDYSLASWFNYHREFLLAEFDDVELALKNAREMKMDIEDGEFRSDQDDYVGTLAFFQTNMQNFKFRVDSCMRKLLENAQKADKVSLECVKRMKNKVSFNNSEKPKLFMLMMRMCVVKLVLQNFTVKKRLNLEKEIMVKMLHAYNELWKRMNYATHHRNQIPGGLVFLNQVLQLKEHKIPAEKIKNQKEDILIIEQKTHDYGVEIDPKWFDVILKIMFEEEDANQHRMDYDYTPIIIGITVVILIVLIYFLFL